MKVIITVVLLLSAVDLADGACNISSDLHGTWTTTNFGTVTIQASSPQLSMTTSFTVSTANTTDFNCLMISGSNYILQSNNTVSVFFGTADVYIYMCVSFTATSTNTYIYYLNSAVENGLDGYRLVGLLISTQVTRADQICTDTTDIAEYNVMVRDDVTGYQLGVVRCPTPLLGLFTFVYTNGGWTYCDNANATINTCNNQSLTGIVANDTGCDAANPFYSNGGELGCLSSLFNPTTGIYYTTLYNGDTTVDNTATYRFSCLAISSASNGNVYLSVKPTVCDAGQTSKVSPRPGALMVLQVDLSDGNCVETEATEQGDKLKEGLLYAGICVAIITGIAVGISISIYCIRKWRRKIAAIKTSNVTGNIPLSNGQVPGGGASLVNSSESYRSLRKNAEIKTSNVTSTMQPLSNGEVPGGGASLVNSSESYRSLQQSATTTTNDGTIKYNSNGSDDGRSITPVNI